MSTPAPQEQEIIRYFRPGCYAVIACGGKAALVKKMRGPFEGMYDLPGGGIEHGEEHSEAIVRELEEEIGIKANAEEMRFVGVFKHVVEYEKNSKLISQHILGIVYLVNVDEAVFASIADGSVVGTEIGGDAGQRLVVDIKNLGGVPLTPVCQQALSAVAKTLQ